MLKKLSVQNFAIIRSLEVNFSEGFTVITGETGAGKSILMGALSLVTGARADSSVLLDHEKKCVVEAEFVVSEHQHGDFFSNEDIDFQQPCIIRREINPAGKSRSFINDIPVSLQQLKQLSSRLVDIHSQHQTLEIKDSEKRFEYLDAYAGHEALLNSYKNEFAQYQRVQARLREMEESAERDAREMDYLKFQLSELDLFKPEPDEYERLREQHDLLSNAEQTAGALSEAVFLMYDSDASLQMIFSRLRSLMPQIARLGEAGKSLQERFAVMDTELKDISSELSAMTDKVVPDPLQLEKVSSRMAGYEQLVRKHQCSDANALCLFHRDLISRCYDFSDKDSRISALRDELGQTLNKVMKAGHALSASRKKAAEKFSEHAVGLLKTLEMKEARIKWEIKSSDSPNSHGIDDVDILFSANAGQTLQALSKTASGGELSRVMLSIKTLVSGVTALPAIIFDEIDTGVSGKVAAAMGSMMRSMGRKMQVISISHLPQVAAHGHDHFEVYKLTRDGVTSTGLRHLTGDSRLQAIALMISHEKVSDAALRHAADLLEAGNLA